MNGLQFLAFNALQSYCEVVRWVALFHLAWPLKHSFEFQKNQYAAIKILTLSLMNWQEEIKYNRYYCLDSPSVTTFQTTFVVNSAGI